MLPDLGAAADGLFLGRFAPDPRIGGNARPDPIADRMSRSTAKWDTWAHLAQRLGRGGA